MAEKPEIEKREEEKAVGTADMMKGTMTALMGLLMMVVMMSLVQKLAGAAPSEGAAGEIRNLSAEFF